MKTNLILFALLFLTACSTLNGDLPVEETVRVEPSDRFR
jgi:hypothetical protein